MAAATETFEHPDTPADVLEPLSESVGLPSEPLRASQGDSFPRTWPTSRALGPREDEKRPWTV
jgi:hypothetical protein